MADGLQASGRRPHSLGQVITRALASQCHPPLPSGDRASKMKTGLGTVTVGQGHASGDLAPPQKESISSHVNDKRKISEEQTRAMWSVGESRDLMLRSESSSRADRPQGRTGGESSSHHTQHSAVPSNLRLVPTPSSGRSTATTTARRPQAVATGFTSVILFTPQHSKEQGLLPRRALSAEINEMRRLEARQDHTTSTW